MLKPAEEEGCRNILRLLSTEDVKALMETITNRHIKVDSQEETENAILAFTQSAEELLKRKKISKEVLVKYLYNERVFIRADAKKTEILETIKEHWSSSKNSLSQMTTLPDQSSLTKNLQGASDHSTPVSEQIVYNLNVTVNHWENHSYNVEAGKTVDEQSKAETFVKWYYNMLNSQSPVLGKPPENFGPHHFWVNAHLVLNLLAMGSEHNETVNGDISVTERLLSFPRENILFSPNLSSSGVAMKSHSYGPKLILVCGMLHKDNDCVGIFRQSFGLINDPKAPEIWKIRVTCLQMKHCFVSDLPKLADSSEVQAMEAHTLQAMQQF